MTKPVSKVKDKFIEMRNSFLNGDFTFVNKKQFCEGAEKNYLMQFKTSQVLETW